MSHNFFHPTWEFGHTYEELESRLKVRLCRQIPDFHLLFNEGGLVLRGTAHTYYAKQLAQHAVMLESPMPILANEIQVS
jgi:hypothetical protein